MNTLNARSYNYEALLVILVAIIAIKPASIAYQVITSATTQIAPICVCGVMLLTFE